MFAHHALVEHEVLQRVLVTEPDILLPRLSTEADQTHTLVAAVPGARTWCATAWPRAPTSTRRPTSWPAWCSPTSARPGRWDLNDPEQVALLVRSELLAGIR